MPSSFHSTLMRRWRPVTDTYLRGLGNDNSQTDSLINVARFCFGLNMFTTLPLELFVCREVCHIAFYER